MEDLKEFYNKLKYYYEMNTYSEVVWRLYKPTIIEIKNWSDERNSLVKIRN